MNIDYGTTTQPINIEVAEEVYKCKYIGDFCLRTVDDTWSEMPAAIFYCPNPDEEKGHSHYLGVYEFNGSIFLTNGISAFSQPIVGVVADNGDVVYSRFRHDYRTSQDKSVWIDGGRDYVRRGSTAETVMLEIKDDVLVVRSKQHKGYQG